DVVGECFSGHLGGRPDVFYEDEGRKGSAGVVGEVPGATSIAPSLRLVRMRSSSNVIRTGTNHCSTVRATHASGRCLVHQHDVGGVFNERNLDGVTCHRRGNQGLGIDPIAASSYQSG